MAEHNKEFEENNIFEIRTQFATGISISLRTNWVQHWHFTSTSDLIFKHLHCLPNVYSNIPLTKMKSLAYVDPKATIVYLVPSVRVAQVCIIILTVVWFRIEIVPFLYSFSQLFLKTSLCIGLIGLISFNMFSSDSITKHILINTFRTVWFRRIF